MDLHLNDLVVGLTPPLGDPGHSRFCVRSIPNFPRHYVGRNSSGCPCILLRGSNHHMHAPIRLAGIEAHFAVPCQIATADGEERQETLTVVACTSSDPQSQLYFLHVCQTIVRVVGTNPTLQQIIDAVGRLVDLFRQLTRPASRSLIGLVGELFTIHRSRNPPIAVRAWRSADDDRFDFAIDDVRLEVKASGDRVRAHNLSAEQCQPPSGTIGVLASLFVERNGGGMSLMELIREVERSLSGDDDLVLKFQETIAGTLGETMSLALTMRFDERLAQSSLQLYDLSVIPAIRNWIPSEVSQVHFRSDLSRTPTVSIQELISRSPRLFDLLPSTA
jgi:putative PD-(D/E)XK family protein DUF4420